MTEVPVILRQSMDWFLYDTDLRHERVKDILNLFDDLIFTQKNSFT